MNNKEKMRKKIKQHAAQKEKAALSSFPLHVKESDATPNQCGECQACCTAVGVHDLPEGQKPMWTRCQYQCDSGCSIYEQRPPSCHDYWCMWQSGMLKGGVENRPDNLGVIFDWRVADNIPNAISVWELRENAIDEPRVREILDRLSLVFPILIRRFNEPSRRRVIGPAQMRNQLIQLGRL